MKCNAWTLGLLSAGLVSLPAVMHAEEKPSSVLTALSATTLSGYVDTSAQWNLGTGNANVPGYAWNTPSKADGFNLNVVELNLEKTVEAADQWGAGYKVSLLAGPDASLFNTKSPVAGGNADFAVKQAYVALHAPVGNGLDFKVGVWDTLIGYEVFESVNNPNVTRSYGYSMEPTTHTGIQATYQVCDVVSASVAIANTYGPTINGRAFMGPANTAAGVQGPQAESYKTYMASMTFTAPTNWGALSGSTLTACIINGFDTAIGGSGGANANGFDQTSFYVGASLATPVTGLKLGACYDYAALTSQAAGPGTSETSGYANAVGAYISYQLTEKLSVYGRGEYASSTYATTFGARKVVEGTATVQYDLWKNLMSRVEFRWDHAADDSNAYGGTVAGSPTKGNAYMLLADFAYKF
ncbi:MAG TPA: YfaZ family outer membrane protein [Verrucomicrobiae bacterium]|nr:YfaZ family outer membrane protein [Verrucomicrobiae bacterium]